MTTAESRGSCRDRTARALLFRYCVRLVDTAERQQFEDHLQSCDECLDDVVAVWRVSDLLEEWAGRHEPHGTLPDLLRAGARRRRAQMFIVATVAAVAGFVLHL